MAGKIPQDFIDDLLSRTDIVDVVGDFVTLRKAGKDFQGLCPFHNEKSPSFTVSQIKQFYHCFGCGANGSAIGFLMEYNRMDFVECIRDLASRAGMQLPENTDQPQNRPNLNPIYDILEHAAAFYARQLRTHPDKARAVDYLKGRGLSGKIAAAYRIGFAPEGWDNLLLSLDTTSENKALLLKAGMVIQKDEGRHYDRFRDRIIFPIRDYKGRVIAFGGRVLDKGEPKYLNSPETPVFHKGRELYGLFEARKRSRDLDRVIVVEGYMDVVALAQFGINNAVASLGTATTADHFQRLFKLTREIVFCFDGDKAGQNAAWKALEISLPFLKDGYSVRFLFLPEGQDPDTLVRSEGPEYFTNIKNFAPLSDYLFRTLSLQTDTESHEGRARLVDLAKPLIARIPQGALRILMEQQLSELSHIASPQLRQIIPDAPPQQGTEAQRPPVQRRPLKNSHKHARSLPEKAIHLLLNHPEFAQLVDLPEELEQLSLGHIPIFIELYRLAKNHPGINTGQILEHWRDTETISALNELLSGSRDLPDEALQGEFEGIILSLQKNLQKQKHSEIVQSSEGKITDRIKDIYKRSDT